MHSFTYSSSSSSSRELIVFLSVVSDVINDVSVGCSVAMEDFLSILTNSDFKIKMIFQVLGKSFGISLID